MMVSIQSCSGLINKGLSHIKALTSENGKVNNKLLDQHQVAIFELAVAHAQLSTAEHFLEFAATADEREQLLANTFAADVCVEVIGRLKRTAPDFGLELDDFAEELQMLKVLQPFLSRD
ncbi:MAG: hypothetical protein ACJA0W_001688, partial [Candidatus Azotimanducaceae bacterium]